ncbi:PLP-dependent aminotransferase family protein [Methanomicrobium sp. W14]|uniref:aminotransferase-like domain-containing protein n=1 Tax=Methanomicrobium sp. W14 TaxID=2817839 RepID=UPI001FDAB5CF|nr:PLP-dependent aminotransferase family protein [Methanomicrobium sp. W14]
MNTQKESFLNRLFDVSNDPEIISFAGGLPDKNLLDVKGIENAAQDVFENEGREALQYTTTTGYLPLREYIAERYKKRLGIPACADEIRIVNGSQQCLDLTAKIFLDKGDFVGIEKPGYLGAIEAFSMYQPSFKGVEMDGEGISANGFRELFEKEKPKFFYGIPNFQNPSGRSYSTERRREIAEILTETKGIFYEDDAFGELSFDNRPIPPVKKFAYDNTIMSGSFSKIIAPGMRMGWIYAPCEIIKKFDCAKQAADLHSNFLCQKIMHHYLGKADIDNHIKKINSIYKRKCRLMCDLCDDILPGDVIRTDPKGGMFMLLTLPKGINSLKLFDRGLEKKVSVLPGIPFYTGKGGEDNVRLNFSSPSEDEIAEGMKRLKAAIDDF